MSPSFSAGQSAAVLKHCSQIPESNTSPHGFLLLLTPFTATAYLRMAAVTNMALAETGLYEELLLPASLPFTLGNW